MLQPRLYGFRQLKARQVQWNLNRLDHGSTSQLGTPRSVPLSIAGRGAGLNHHLVQSSRIASAGARPAAWRAGQSPASSEVTATSRNAWRKIDGSSTIRMLQPKNWRLITNTSSS